MSCSVSTSTSHGSHGSVTCMPANSEKGMWHTTHLNVADPSYISVVKKVPWFSNASKPLHKTPEKKPYRYNTRSYFFTRVRKRFSPHSNFNSVYQTACTEITFMFVQRTEKGIWRQWGKSMSGLCISVVNHGIFAIFCALCQLPVPSLSRLHASKMSGVHPNKMQFHVSNS